MTCAEFELFLPEMLEGTTSTDLQRHLDSCCACSELASDLQLITQQARRLSLDVVEDPSPRVWNSIEIALKQEGLIASGNRTRPARAASPSMFAFWRPAWSMVLAAAFVLTFAVLLNQRGTGKADMAASLQPSISPSLAAVASPYSNDDQRILAAVSSRSPALRPAYEANIQNVNAYIRDAEQWAKNNPNDQEAQQYLMNAYEQRAVVYDMAMEHSLQ
jgi:hypothetical protein